ncbi:MAG: hypothetical protein IKQ95_05790 [Synergistaceae bacterium]|nr:hypothetical protein [Synergistaceae bacterium]
MYTVENVKALAKVRTPESFDTLLEIFRSDENIDVSREAVSSIGRHNDSARIYSFLREEAFSRDNPMELIYQMFRTCLYRSRDDERFSRLRDEMIAFWDNEIIGKMNEYYNFRQPKEKPLPVNRITSPLLLIGDNTETLKALPENSVQLIFTSPPYYNAREYSDYSPYAVYLSKMGETFSACHRVLEDGRFIIVNVSPVITRRPGREFESIRYPIHYDLHRVLTETGYYFVDEILWVKPEPSGSDRHDDEPIDTTNCWYIAPKYDKNHPAVFPEELCRKVLRYYSFEGDTVLDTFASSGTFGRAARKMARIPVLC